MSRDKTDLETMVIMVIRGLDGGPDNHWFKRVGVPSPGNPDTFTVTLSDGARFRIIVEPLN